MSGRFGLGKGYFKITNPKMPGPTFQWKKSSASFSVAKGLGAVPVTQTFRNGLFGIMSFAQPYV
jgi:hypothetical protein